MCNLASIALNMFVKERVYDFQRLHDVAKVVTRNLNRIIDINYYPIIEARNSNMRHRPIGIGVQVCPRSSSVYGSRMQGLADTYILMRLPFESDGAATLNVQIFETIYHAALEASMEMAKRDGPYKTYEGSPVSKGILQPDMWGVKTTDLWDWETLRAKIKA